MNSHHPGPPGNEEGRGRSLSTCLDCPTHPGHLMPGRLAPRLLRRKGGPARGGTCQGARLGCPTTQVRLQVAGLADPGLRAHTGDLQGAGSGPHRAHRLRHTSAQSYTFTLTHKTQTNTTQHLHAGETHNVNTLLFPRICSCTLSMNTHLCTPSHMHVITTITTHSQMYPPSCAHPLPPTVPQTLSHTCTHTLIHSCSGTDTLTCPHCSGSPYTAGPLGTR